MHWSLSTNWADNSRCLGLGSLNAVKFSLLLSSFTPLINVFGASWHLSGSLQASFLLAGASQSWLLIGWLWAPAQTRPRLLHHLPHCGHDTDNLAEWEKWRADIKWKSERDLQHSYRMILLPLLSVSDCTSAWPYFDHTQRKKSLSCSVLRLPPCVINQSSIVNYHYLETLTIRSHAAVLININQSQPPRVFFSLNMCNVLLARSRVPRLPIRGVEIMEINHPKCCDVMSLLVALSDT